MFVVRTNLTFKCETVFSKEVLIVEHNIFMGKQQFVLKNHFYLIGIRLDLDFLCSEFNFEIAGFCLAKLKIIKVALYRSPGGDPNMFLERLNDL